VTIVVPSDLDIARQARLKPLADIAQEMGVGEFLWRSPSLEPSSPR
jgi:hypothetical protein